ncbi:GMP synthase [Halobacteriales archaeon QS_9_67_15]|nr:MAG: GMP synthase [Halobacteriales archaeon QS_9_67_15]
METLDLYVVRNEVNEECRYHCDALAALFPDATVVDFPAGERVPLEEADGVVLTGSTAGVYEADERPWIHEQKKLVRDVINRDIPTLGVCFGHQVINAALDGTVEAVGTTAALVRASLDDDPLFKGVNDIVVSLHGDAVVETGREMEVIASADHASVFGTRHRSAPVWTVQFHPEIDALHEDRLVEDFDWDVRDRSFDAVTGHRVSDNFRSLVREWWRVRAPENTERGE